LTNPSHLELERGCPDEIIMPAQCFRSHAGTCVIDAPVANPCHQLGLRGILQTIGNLQKANRDEIQRYSRCHPRCHRINGAPFRIKPRTHASLKLLYNFFVILIQCAPTDRISPIAATRRHDHSSIATRDCDRSAFSHAPIAKVFSGIICLFAPHD
jgi:hypothetical protein